jgi:putative flippase GtrA
MDKKIQDALRAACTAAFSDYSAGRTMVRKEGIRARLLRILRMLIVGFWSSVVDLGVLTSCVHWGHIEATLSRVIALAVSGVCLFVGCRSFAFRSKGGSLSRQAGWFVVGELLGFPLNLLVFHGITRCAPFLAPELASQAANFFVFVAFAYPVRRLLVFQIGAKSTALHPNALPGTSRVSRSTPPAVLPALPPGAGAPG